MTSTEEQQTAQQTKPSMVIECESTNKKIVAMKLLELDSLPDKILLHISKYLDKDTCFLSFIFVNKRFNKLFITHKKKKELPETALAPSCISFRDILWKCFIYPSHENEDDRIPKIYYQLASCVLCCNRIDLLDWVLKSQSTFIYHSIVERAIKDKNLCIMKKVWNSIENEHLLNYMKAQKSFISYAARIGDLDSLRYLHEEIECEWNTRQACIMAAQSGSLECLVYLHENGCEWSVYACEAAARTGNLECLRYLHENGCEWNSFACCQAALYGKLDCLKYMQDNGLEWIWYNYFLGASAMRRRY